jgi:hypothetical protein
MSVEGSVGDRGNLNSAEMAAPGKVYFRDNDIPSVE